MTDADHAAGAPPVAPPVTTWPTVIGVIAIIVGSMGIFGYGCLGTGFSMAAMLFGDAVREAVEGTRGLEIQAAQVRAFADKAPLMIASNLANGTVAVLLLLGGVGVLRRRARGATICLAWAALKIVVSVPSTYLGFQLNEAQFTAIAEADAMPAIQGAVTTSVMQSFGTAGLVVGVLWALALPVFMIVWFTRRRIRGEVRSWSAKELRAVD